MRPAIGSVKIQAKRILRTTLQLSEPDPLRRPIPIMAELETCVVETGNPLIAVAMTKTEVAKLAANPSR